MAQRPAVKVYLIGLACMALAACSTSGGTATPRLSPSPVANAASQKYLSIIHGYWIDYESARSHFEVYCYFGPINPRACGMKAQAILVVDENFLTQLQAATPPPQFAADHQLLLNQMPKVIVAVKGMIAAGASGNSDATVNATLEYVDTMVPTVVEALDRIDPGVTHT